MPSCKGNTFWIVIFGTCGGGNFYICHQNKHFGGKICLAVISIEERHCSKKTNTGDTFKETAESAPRTEKGKRVGGMPPRHMQHKWQETAEEEVAAPTAGAPLDVRIWGPEAWGYMHATTFAYPKKEPTKKEKHDIVQFFYYLASTLPCERCRKDFLQNIRQHPVPTENRYVLSKWLVDRHNDVNKKLGKPMVSYSHVQKKYEDMKNTCPSPSRRLPKTTTTTTTTTTTSTDPQLLPSEVKKQDRQEQLLLRDTAFGEGHRDHIYFTQPDAIQPPNSSTMILFWLLVSIFACIIITGGLVLVGFFLTTKDKGPPTSDFK